MSRTHTTTLWMAMISGCLGLGCAKSTVSTGALIAGDLAAEATTGVPITIDVIDQNHLSPTTSFTLKSLGDTQYGTATVVDNKVSYLSYVAPKTDSFTYTLDDGKSTATGTIKVTISPASLSAAAPPDTTPPTIVATSPDAGAQGVSAFVPLAITFSEPMDPGSVQVSVSTNQGPVGLPDGVWSPDATKVTFAAPDAGYGGHVTYTATVNGQDVAGNPLTAGNTTNFTIGSGPVQPLSAWISLPVQNAPYAAGTSFYFAFNDPVNASMVSAISGIAGVSCHLDAVYNTQIDCTFTSALQPSNYYEIDIDGSAPSVDGWTFGNDARWTILTADAPATVQCNPPVITAVGPADNAVVTPGLNMLQLWFSAPMDQLSLENALSFKINGQPVTFALSDFSWWPNLQSVGAFFTNNAGYNATFSWSLNKGGNIPTDKNGCEMNSTAAAQTHTYISQKHTVLQILPRLTGQVEGSNCTVTPADGTNPYCYTGFLDGSTYQGALTFPFSITGTKIVSAFIEIQGASNHAASSSEKLMLRNVAYNATCMSIDHVTPFSNHSGDTGMAIPLSVPADGIMYFDVTQPLQYNLDHHTGDQGQLVTEWDFGYMNGNMQSFDDNWFGFSCFQYSSSNPPTPTLSVTYY